MPDHSGWTVLCTIIAALAADVVVVRRSPAPRHVFSWLGGTSLCGPDLWHLRYGGGLVHRRLPPMAACGSSVALVWSRLFPSLRKPQNVSTDQSQQDAVFQEVPQAHRHGHGRRTSRDCYLLSPGGSVLRFHDGRSICRRLDESRRACKVLGLDHGKLYGWICLLLHLDTGKKDLQCIEQAYVCGRQQRCRQHCHLRHRPCPPCVFPAVSRQYGGPLAGSERGHEPRWRADCRAPILSRGARMDESRLPDVYQRGGNQCAAAAGDDGPDLQGHDLHSLVGGGRVTCGFDDRIRQDGASLLGRAED